MPRQILSRSTWSALLAVLVVAGCQAPLGSPSPTVTGGPTPRPTPTAVPTPETSPGPSGTPVITPAELVVRVTVCFDVCEPTPGTTVLSDGRIVWELPERRAFESRLTPEALATIREALARDELAADGDYHAQLRPGAQPIPRGATVYGFEVGPGDPVRVTSGDPQDFAQEPRLWIIPPEMDRLARLATRLLDPVGWLGPAALAEPARPYAPDRYLLLVELFPGIGEMPEFPADLDEVESPFDRSLDAVGEVIPDPAFPRRCLAVDAVTAAALASAEGAAGVRRDLAAWASAVAYRWQRGQGFAQVTLTQLLPHETEPCSAVPTSL